MSLGIAGFIGIAPQILFVGGASSLSFITIPIILKDYVPNEVKLKQFSDLYDLGKNIFATSALLSTISYAVEAYLNRNDQNVFFTALTSSIISFTPLPFTIIAIAPYVKALKNFPLNQTGKEKTSEINALLKQWSILNLGRAALFSVGLFNTLVFISKTILGKTA